MTLAGFDGFRIHKSDQSFLFLGDGSEDGKFAPGTLCVLTHKDKEVSNALKGAGIQPLDAEIVQEVAECHGPICTGEVSILLVVSMSIPISNHSSTCILSYLYQCSNEYA